MVDINLIASRRAQRQRSVAMMRLAFYGLLGMGLLLLLIWAWMSTRIALVNGQIAETDASLNVSSLRKSMSRIDFLENRIDSINPKAAVLQKVHESETRWIQVLHDIGASAPAEAGVTGLSSHRADKQHVVSLTGSAESQRLIGAYMLTLQQSNWCDKLDLVQASSSHAGGRAWEFEITVPLKEPIGLNIMDKQKPAEAKPEPTDIGEKS